MGSSSNGITSGRRTGSSVNGIDSGRRGGSSGSLSCSGGGCCGFFGSSVIKTSKGGSDIKESYFFSGAAQAADFRS